MGEAPDSRALEVAREVNLELREDVVAQLFVPSKDIVIYDLAVVMDKVRFFYFILFIFFAFFLGFYLFIGWGQFLDWSFTWYHQATGSGHV